MVKGQKGILYSKKAVILTFVLLFLLGSALPAVSADNLMGDLNGDSVIDISDVILELRMALKIDSVQPCSDINNDGVVDISDVILTLRMALKLDPLKTCNLQPTAITITSPSDGSTINRPDVMVKGTITNTTGNETGVVVNGMVAITYGSQFVVNHVPLIDGSNTITASATDTAGNTTTTSLTVNAVTTSPHITLNANITSGISPLITFFSVSTEIPNAVTTYQMDYEGDGTVDYTGTTFDNISFTYTSEDIYYPKLTVTDTQGITYSDQIAIVVLNAANLDALLRAKWNAMKTALMAGDIETALNYFVEGSKNKYNTIFTQMSSADINSIFSNINEFKIYSINERVAQCGAIRVESGGTFSYPVTFVKDENGIWNMMGF